MHIISTVRRDVKVEKITLIHGEGGKQSNNLIKELFIKHFNNKTLKEMGDAACLTLSSKKIAFTTDSYVVNPIFFSGGNIGKLALCGTINDLAVSGAKPVYITAGFIIEDGFPYKDLEEIVSSMGTEAKKAGVQIVAGDTKVVEKGLADGIYINTSGIGIIEDNININAKNVATGDVIILSGTLGDHGTAISCERNNFGIKGDIMSDCAALNSLVEEMLNVCPKIHMMRDATRGGLAAVLNEIAEMSNAEITIYEKDIPISDGVKGVCYLLGLDPLYLANEGKLCAILPEEYSEIVLEVMKKNPLGKDAAIIGNITEGKKGKVYLKTIIGGTRIIDMPSGIQLPRIC
nr:hydrogenase expression/formation protein HypE [Clostridium sp. YIM B02551]